MTETIVGTEETAERSNVTVIGLLTARVIRVGNLTHSATPSADSSQYSFKKTNSQLSYDPSGTTFHLSILTLFAKTQSDDVFTRR